MGIMISMGRYVTCRCFKVHHCYLLSLGVRMIYLTDTNRDPLVHRLDRFVTNEIPDLYFMKGNIINK